MSNYTKKAVRGASVVLVMMAASYFLGYVFRILIARFGTSAYGLEGVEAYGLVYSIISFFGFFSLFMNFGLRSSLVKHIAGYRVHDKPEKIKGAIIIVSLTTLLLSSIVCGTLILLSDWIAAVYFKKVPAIYTQDLSMLIKIYGLGMIFSSIILSLKNIFIGFQDMTSSSSTDLVKSIITTALAALLLYAGYSKEPAAIISFTLSYIVFLPVIYIPLFLKKTFPGFLKTKAELTWSLAKRIYKFGVLVAVTDFSGLVLGQTDTMLLTYFRSLKEAGLYNAALPTMKLVNVIATATTQVLFPMSAELWAKGHKEQLSRGLGLLYKYALIVVFPVTLFIFLFPEVILGTLFGEDFRLAANVLRIFAVGYFLHTFTVANNSTLIGIGKPKDVGSIALAGAVVNLALNLILIPPYGIEGAAVADVLGLITAFVLSTARVKKYVSLPLPWRDFAVTVTAGALVIGLVQVIKMLGFLGMWSKFALSVAAGGALYVLVLFLFRTLTREDLKKLGKRVI